MGLALDGVAARAVRAIGGVGLGAAVYAAACRALRLAELDELLAAVRRRRRRG